MHALAGALGLEFGHRGFRHRVADLVRRAGLERLAGIEFDHVAARFLGLGDGFKGGEFLESVGLGADEPAVLAEVFRDRIGMEVGGEGKDQEGNRAHGLDRVSVV